MRPPTLAVFLVLALGGAALSAPPAWAQDVHHTVSGTVTNDQGEPLAGARVSGYTYDPDGQWRGGDDATTDADGAYALRLPPGKGSVQVWYEEYRRGDGREIVVEGDVPDVSFVLPTPPPKTAIVAGVVRDAAGNPVPGATVTIGYGCCVAYAESTEGASDAGGSDGSAGAPATTESVEPEVAPSPPTESPPQPDNESSARVRETTIWYPDHEYDHQTTRADDAGRFRFATYPGPRQVTAHAPGFAQSSVQVEAQRDATVEVDLTLERIPPADAVVRGIVTDARTGLPVAGAWVSLQNVEWGRWNGTTTGSDGRFAFTTIPGWIQIHVSAENVGIEPRPLLAEDGAKPAPAPGKRYYAHAQSRLVESGTNAVDVALEPRPEPSIVVTGYVVDPIAQRGVPNARVNVWNQDTGDWGEAVTDATGSYRILARPGHHQMSAWADGYLGAVKTFVVRDDAGAQRVDLEMPRGTSKYAPCDACADDAVPAMERPVAASGAKGAPAVAAMDADDARESATVGESADGEGTRAASYEGGGGGLPPYDPAATDVVPGASAKRADVPAPAVAALLVLAALAAVARRRR